MLIRSMTVGELMTNCYIVIDDDTSQCVVIDPGAESGIINSFIDNQGLTCKYIIATHGHNDHMMALGDVARYTGATFCMNFRPVLARAAKAGKSMEFAIPTIDLHDGDVLTCGSLRFQVLETPGHTEDGICLVCGNALFTGDTLFKGSCGAGPSLPGTDYNVLKKSLLRLYELPGDYDVYPGHMDFTKLEYERHNNVYMQNAYSIRLMEELKK